MKPASTHHIAQATLRSFGRLAGPGVDRVPRLLGYHAVGDAPNPVCMPTGRFRQHVEWLLAHGYRLLTLREWWHHGQRPGERARPAAILTFDDGYREVLLNAAPILGEYGIKATLFVVTDYVGKTNAYDRDRKVPEMRLLDWSEVRELQRRGWDIQSHGRRHVPLAGLPDDFLDDELAGSKAAIEQTLGTPVEFFAYPYGIVNDLAARAVARAGYVAAVTCEGDALPPPGETRSYRLPRVMCDQLLTVGDFGFRLSPAYRRLRRVRAWVSGPRDSR